MLNSKAVSDKVVSAGSGACTQLQTLHAVTPSTGYAPTPKKNSAGFLLHYVAAQTSTFPVGHHNKTSHREVSGKKQIQIDCIQ